MTVAEVLRKKIMQTEHRSRRPHRSLWFMSSCPPLHCAADAGTTPFCSGCRQSCFLSWCRFRSVCLKKKKKKMLEAAVGVFWLMSKNVKLVCWTSVTVTTFSRTRTGHRQPDQDWICFDGQRWGNRDWLPRDRPERLSRALIAFPMRVDATFNWTELKAKQSTLDWRNVQTQKRSEFSTCFECIQAGLPSTSEFFSDVQRPQKQYRSLGTGGGGGGGGKGMRVELHLPFTQLLSRADCPCRCSCVRRSAGSSDLLPQPVPLGQRLTCFSHTSDTVKLQQ